MDGTALEQTTMRMTGGEGMPGAVKRVRFITLDEARPGMRLAIRVQKVHEYQLFQIPAGVDLSDDLIAQMRHRHVHAIAIEFDDPRSPDEVACVLGREQERIRAVFSAVAGANPVAESLRRSALAYRERFC